MKSAAFSLTSVIAATGSAIVACAAVALYTAPTHAQAPREPVIFLDQAWSQGDREWYYQFSQGSSVISYDIFLNLEVAGSQELFRGDANSERFGLIPQAPKPGINPDGLPIGLSKTSVPKALVKDEHIGDYVGLNCAACHNAQLNYQGKRIRIDGGVGNTFDLMGFVYALGRRVAGHAEGRCQVRTHGGPCRRNVCGGQGFPAHALRERCRARAPVPHACPGGAYLVGTLREWTRFPSSSIV